MRFWRSAPCAFNAQTRQPGRSGTVAFVALLLGAVPALGHAQGTRTLTACTPDALRVCTELRLTAGPTIFELALRPVGASDAALPLSVYNLVLGTGAPAAAAPRTTAVGPVALGGATVIDPSPWEMVDVGDALFLSSFTNRGVGSCLTGADVGGFGQAARACGVGQFVTFTFTPTRAFVPDAFTILNLEAVALTTPLQAASCGAPGAACVITADTAAVVPEPSAGALLALGLSAAAAFRTVVRRRLERSA